MRNRRISRKKSCFRSVLHSFPNQLMNLANFFTSSLCLIESGRVSEGQKDAFVRGEGGKGRARGRKRSEGRKTADEREREGDREKGRWKADRRKPE